MDMDIHFHFHIHLMIYFIFLFESVLFNTGTEAKEPVTSLLMQHPLT